MSTNDELDLFAEEAAHGEPSGETPAVPEKYKGKTVEDLIKMNQHADRKIGQLGNEVGSLRRMSDRLLELTPKQDNKAQLVAAKPVTVETLLNDPANTLKSAIEESDLGKRTQAAEARADRLEARISERDFTSRFPSYKEDMEDAKFLDFIKSTKLRSELSSAAATGNFDAGTRLWEEWEDRKQFLDSTATTETKPRKDKVPSTMRSTPSEGRVTGKKFSRVKVMELKEKAESGDPAAKMRWNSKEFQQELGQAHLEGRVV